MLLPLKNKYENNYQQLTFHIILLLEKTKQKRECTNNEAGFAERLSSQKMKSVIRVRVLDGAVCDSLYGDTIDKGMNPALFNQAISK